MTSTNALTRVSALWQMLPALEVSTVNGRPNCINEDPELFFPLDGDAAGIAEAKTVCRSCPLINRCLSLAVRRGEHGIWGGTTEQERREIRRPADTRRAA